MNQLELKLQELKDQTIDTMHLVRSQLARAKDCYINLDRSLAREIIHYENRVNATELSIDRDCEKLLALYRPVAIDLRFVLATIRINGHLERIGDHAYGVAKYVLYLEHPFEEELLQKIRFREMFDTAISMIDDAIHSFNFEDTNLARWVFGKDATLNSINNDVGPVIVEYCKANPDRIEDYLYLFSIMRKIERIGDLAKNVAEETIFYLEAKVLRHADKKIIEDKH